MEPTILDVYWTYGPPLAAILVIAAAVVLYRQGGDRLAVAAIAVAGLAGAFFAPAAALVFGAGFLVYSLFLRKRGSSQPS